MKRSEVIERITNYVGKDYKFRSFDFYRNSPFTHKELIEETRKREIVIYRSVCMIWHLMEIKSWTKVGKMFGKDHATVIHCAKRFIEAIDGYDQEMKMVIDRIISNSVSTGYDLNIFAPDKDDVCLSHEISLLAMEEYAFKTGLVTNFKID